MMIKYGECGKKSYVPRYYVEKMGVRDTMCEDCCENVQQDIDSLSVKEKKRLGIIE